MRAIFFGTPEIAVPSLEALREVAEVVAVVCQPDRPAGRGLELRAPPVKERALALGLEVVQPEKVKTPEFAAWVEAQKADVALVVAYGRILPKAVLEGPRCGCMNLHASLLPRYRGAAPIQWAIVRGEAETGVCLMQMDEGMDTGPVFSRRAIPIGRDETAGELGGRLGRLAAEIVREDLLRAVSGELSAMPQDEAAATMAPMLKKEDGRLDWSAPAREVHDRARGMNPWPSAHTLLGGKLFRVLETRVADEEGARGEPGTLLRADKGGVLVACGRGSLSLLRGQLEGKRALGAPELVAGRVLVPGARLG